MADTNEALGEQMQEEAAQELIDRQSHQFLLIVVRRIAPTKGDVAVGQRYQSMVGDGDAVGVTAEILKHILGAAEGWFRVDDPVFSKQWSQPGGEEFGLREHRQIPGKVQLAMLKGRLETGDELAAKHPPDHGNGEKEARVRSNPASVIEREPTRGDDTVDMGVNLEFLVPGMQHAEEADLSPEMGGVPRHLQKRICAGPQQQTVDDLFIL